MEKITLSYGMKLKDKQGKQFVINRYWENDTDPMEFKVKVGQNDFYSSDLVSLIRLGTFEIVKE